MPKKFTIDTLISSLVKKDIFYKIQGRKILLYDLNILTKELMEWLFRHDTYVTGFLLEDNRKDYAEIRYFNKPMFFFDELDGTEVIIDTFGDNLESIKLRTFNEVYTIYTPPPINSSSIVIYGAGYRGKELYELLSLYHFNVLNFCDKDVQKHGKSLCGIDIISPKNLKEKHQNIDLIVAIGKVKLSVEIANDLEKNFNIENIFYYDNQVDDYFSLQLSYIKDKSQSLYYIIQIIKVKKYKIMIYGKTDIVVSLIKKFMLLDIIEIVGISEDGFAVDRDGVKFIDKTDLIKMDLRQVMVIVLNDSLESAKIFIKKFNLDASHFVKTNLFRINSNTVYDPNIGFNVECSILHLKTKDTFNAKRIGILGDSTTVVGQRFEKSWVEYFLQESYINMEVFVGAAGAHTSSQNLIKLIRDFSHMNLDIVIYYGYVNEYVYTEAKNHFIHTYQQKIFDKLNKINPKGIRYENGIADSIDHWLHQVCMMYGICKELGIKFHAILAPIPALKIPRSLRDIEYIEHLYTSLNVLDEAERTEKTKLLCKKIKGKNFSYISDFTTIFNDRTESIFLDRVHVFDYANEIIAKQIFNIIENDLKK